MSAKKKSYSDYPHWQEIINLSDQGKSSRQIESMLGVHHLMVCIVRKKYGWTKHIKAGRKEGFNHTEEQKQKQKAWSTKHGLWHTKFYRMYYSILQRCNNTTTVAYHSYGGRGIKCERQSFKEFTDDMYDLYLAKLALIGEKEISIERINVNGNYCKANCTFIPFKHQMRNQQRQARLRVSIV